MCCDRGSLLSGGSKGCSVGRRELARDDDECEVQLTGVPGDSGFTEGRREVARLAVFWRELLWREAALNANCRQGSDSQRPVEAASCAQPITATSARWISSHPSDWHASASASAASASWLRASRSVSLVARSSMALCLNSARLLKDVEGRLAVLDLKDASPSELSDLSGSLPARALRMAASTVRKVEADP